MAIDRLGEPFLPAAWRRRLASMPIISTTWRRRATSSPSALASELATGDLRPDLVGEQGNDFGVDGVGFDSLPAPWRSF